MEMKTNGVQLGAGSHLFTDGQGSALPGFDWKDCRPLHGDSVRHRLTWKHAVISTVRNRAIRLELRLRQAELYALDVT